MLIGRPRSGRRAAALSVSRTRWAYFAVVPNLALPSTRPITGRLSRVPSPAGCKNDVDRDFGNSVVRDPREVSSLQELSNPMTRSRKASRGHEFESIRLRHDDGWVEIRCPVNEKCK